MEAATGSGASGGTTSGGSAGRFGGAADNPSVANVECGDAVCQAAGGVLGFMSACCLDAASSTCGVSIKGHPCGLPPEPDPRCPSVEIPGGIAMFASCCTDRGKCGFNASLLGAGCIDLAEVLASGMMQGDAMIALFEPLACEPRDAGSEADGGAEEDAGR